MQYIRRKVWSGEISSSLVMPGKVLSLDNIMYFCLNLFQFHDYLQVTAEMYQYLEDETVQMRVGNKVLGRQRGGDAW